MQTQESGREAVNGATVHTMAETEKGAEAPVFLVNFGLSWKQIIAGASIVSGLLGTAGVTGWMVLPSDLRKVEGQVGELQTQVTGLKTTIKDFDQTQGQVIDVLLEVRDAVARLGAASAPAAIPEPPAELRPSLPRRAVLRPRRE